MRRRQVRRALDRAVRGLRRRPRQVRARLGHTPRPAGDRPPARRQPRHRGRLRDAVRDLDRHRPRRRGDRRRRAREGRAAGGRRRLRPRRREARAGRVGRGRRRRRLPEGADDPAGPRVRVRLAARARRRRRQARRPLLLRLGRDRQAAAQGPAEQPLHAAGDAARRTRRLARHDRGRGDRGRVGAPRAARPRHARRRGRARPRALRRSGRALERRHRDRAAGVDRRQAGPEDPARQLRHHRQRRPGPARRQDHPHRALRLLRRLRHPHVPLRTGDDARAARPPGRPQGAGVGAAQKVFLEAGVPAASAA